MVSKIATHLITGFLGSGKTTAIKALIAQKPANENWAIIVNEFGQVGVDPLAIELRDDLQLTPLVGGCVCCQLGSELHASLKTLLQTQHFDRLLIEPTGMGHPAGILDTLRKPFFKQHLDLRAVICLVDPRQLADAHLIQDQTFLDQINMADVVIANKADLAADEDLKAMDSLVQSLYPPKQHYLTTRQGYFDFTLLDCVREGLYQAVFPASHSHHGGDQHAAQPHHPPAVVISEPSQPEPCRPVRQMSEGLGRVSCGWIFHPDDIFPFDELEALLASIKGAERIKGAFRLGLPWVFINRVGTEMDYDHISYRRDSRVEIIARQPLDWDAIEVELVRLVEIGVNSPYRDL
jgi:G3E family GTPase